MIRALILASVALVALSAFTPKAEAHRNRKVVIVKKPARTVVVPAATVVVRPARPCRDAVWVAGYWRWCGPRIGYRWVSGHWTTR